MRAPTTIHTHLDLADYKRFIRSHIIQMQEKIFMDTKEKIVGIFSIIIQVFRLPHAGAGGGRTIPSLKKHIMRREIRYIDPEKNNQNLCFFLAYSFITIPDIKAEGSVTDKHYKEHSQENLKLLHFQIPYTRPMIEPLDYLIDMFFNYKIDMLQFMSMSACANAIKYVLAYWNFKLDQDYTPKDDYASFNLKQNYWNIKVQNYLEQDKRRNRDTSNNIKESDCAFYRKLFLSTGCHIYKARFTSKNPPTLDRINNDRGHSADNVKPCCLFCNQFKSNKDENLTRLVTQLKNFCYCKNLPMTITDEDVYQILRSGITGGLSQVMHRYNVAGETKINQLKYINGKVISKDTDHIMTHLQTLDFNCQYPSVMSSEPHKFIKYTGGPFDMNRVHYICGGTDSMTWAISGNPEEDYRQKFKYSVMRQKERHALLQLQKFITFIILQLMRTKGITIIV
ncbi:MAG: hypothetical protein EZS28_019016 [Streblomastix strix]|uniref:DNA-directed DNA polymerase n=1 Tax=Streblomastix strix TaxID=222440 RepID=A0A5J4VS99_9EUKA|nr:MAG: hypothetical protein EZS28_019016 [Streblomastix strix]